MARTTLLLFVSFFSLSCVHRGYVCADFYASARRKRIFPTIRPDILAKYIDLDRSLGYVSSRHELYRRGEGGYSFSGIICSLFSLGQRDFDESELEVVERGLFDIRDEHASSNMMVYSLVRKKVRRGLLKPMEEELRREALESLGRRDPWRRSLALYRYLHFAAFFDLGPHRGTVDRVLASISAERKEAPGRTSPRALIGDLYISWLLGARDKEAELAEFLENIREKRSFFPLLGHEERRNLKDIYHIAMLDLRYGVVPEEHLIDMAAYALARVNDDGSITLEGDERDDASLLSGACGEFCQVRYWQVVQSLSYLLSKLGEHENEIKAEAALKRKDISRGLSGI
ncbi:hypothetical protein ACFL2T_03410 [Elusimicrobiota bacterium]